MSETLDKFRNKFRNKHARYPAEHDIARHIATLETQLSDARKEEELNAALLLKLSDLLTRTVNEIKGQPPELTQWSHHDLPDLAKELMAKLAESKVDLKDANGEIAELDALNIKLSKLLDGVCESVKGTPPEDTLYSWHDLPEMVKELKEKMMEAEELTDKSIDAYQRLDSKHCDLKVDIAGLETRIDILGGQAKHYKIECERLREVASNFLKDLEERVSRDGQHHPNEGVRDYLGNGKTLPVGNGVLFAMDEALSTKSA